MDASVFKSYLTIVTSEEWQAFEAHFSRLTLDEKKAMAKRLNAQYVSHDDLSVCAMRIKYALVQTMGLNKYRPGYQEPWRRKELLRNMIIEHQLRLQEQGEAK